MANSSQNNPFVPLNQQLLINQNTQKRISGVIDAVNSPDTLAKGLLAAGISSVGGGDILNTLFAAAQALGFTSNSPLRITENELANRNFSRPNNDPNLKVQTSIAGTTSIGANFVYPNPQAPYCMMLNFYQYQRPTPLGKVTWQPQGKVTLPIPEGSGLVDNTTANWQEKSLGLTGNILDGVKNSNNIKNATTKDAATNQLGDATAYALASIQTAMIGEAVQSELGVAPNPSLSLLFQGVGFRDFTLRWTFAPKNDEESVQVKDIINFLKARHLPTFSGQGQQGGSSFLFNYPSVVQPVIITPNITGSSPYMTKFKHCAIKQVNVSYAPQGLPSFYVRTSAPAFIQLTINLEEIEIMTAADYDPTATGTNGATLISAEISNIINGYNEAAKPAFAAANNAAANIFGG